jgi:hypothetical protein
MPKIMPAVLPILSSLLLSRPALPRRNKPITIALITIAATIIALIIDVTITIDAITENLTLLFFPGSSSAELRHACFKLSSRDVSRHCRLGATPR